MIVDRTKTNYGTQLDTDLDSDKDVDVSSSGKYLKGASVFHECSGDDFEISNREKWAKWAASAAEGERRRRIEDNEELDRLEVLERNKRRQWALEAIEKERNDRISSQFLDTLTSSSWFLETISTYSEDYELVCPYYKLGCRACCRRASVERHLKECPYALEAHDTPALAQDSWAEYEVVCLFSRFGCTFTGTLSEVKEHILTCSLQGLTPLEESEERRLLKQHVIEECEEERVRQLLSPSNRFKSPSGLDRPSCVHGIILSQMHQVHQMLHDQALLLWSSTRELVSRHAATKEHVSSVLSNFIKKLWPASFIEVYGSYVTKLSCSGPSDLDLVVCFSNGVDTVSGQSLARYINSV